MLKDHLADLRQLRNTDGNLKRGSHPVTSFDEPAPFIENLAAGVVVGIGAAIVAAIVLFIHPVFFRGSGLFYALENGFVVGVGATFLFFCWPIVAVIIYIFTKFNWPDRDFIQKFGPVQKGVPFLLLGFLLTTGFNHVWPYAENIIKYGHAQMAYMPPKPLKTLSFIFLWLTATSGLTYVFNASWRAPKRFNKATEDDVDYKNLPFTLWLGNSTGKLANLYHGASIAADQQVALTLADAAQNILVLGAIGSGKTTRAIHPILMQLLDQNCGGLIFDIKGDFQKAVLEFAKITGRDITTIGVNAKKMNLLAGLTPEVASSFLKSIFMLNSQHHGDQFWLDTATELCRNVLGVLSFVPEYYSLQGLYLYLFDLNERLEIENKITAATDTLDKKQVRLLRSYLQYQEKIFDKFDEKVKAGVNATIAQVLAPFNHPELVDAFCSEDTDNIHMEEVLNGAVYLVELPLSVWGLGGKVVYTMIKLRFFNVMQQRLTRTEWDQERPVFFMCDEFQEIVSANRDGLSDLNFWDKSRSSKTIGIISAQAISSFYAAIGNRDTTHALLQNFRQKLCFRTEDTTTIQYFDTLADKVEVEKKTYSHTISRGESSHPKNLFNSKSTTSSSTENITFTEKSILNAQLFRTLSPEQALALLSIHGHSMDDVINMMTIFL